MDNVPLPRVNFVANEPWLLSIILYLYWRHELLVPNGIALQQVGSFLVANLGTEGRLVHRPGRRGKALADGYGQRAAFARELRRQ